MPVCGEDKKNYLNLCALKCQGVRLAHFGECKTKVLLADTCNQCSKLKNPICGSDGEDYDNECQCTCKGTCKKYADGKCPNRDLFKCQDCVGVISKVCGKDGTTYDNFCFAQCNKTETLYHGACVATEGKKGGKKPSPRTVSFDMIGVTVGTGIDAQEHSE